MSEPSKPTQTRDARLAIVVAVLQALLALTWTLYALFLPPLAERAGISRAWVPWVLLADQVAFVVLDWVMGVYSDRAERAFRRVGPMLVGAAVMSSLLLLLLPATAALGLPSLFIAVAVLWAAVSSLLRTPAMALLGKAAPSGRTLVANVSLLGVGLAGAVGPLLTGALQGVSPMLPFAIASIVLIAATVPVLVAETSAPSGPAQGTNMPWQATIGIALVALLGSLGTQFHTVLAPNRMPDLDAASRSLWPSLFWGGFAVGLLVAAIARSAEGALRFALVALPIGALAIWCASFSVPFAAKGTAVAVSGACWGVALSAGFRRVLDLNRGAGFGTALGVFLSTLALAAAVRILLVATGLAANARVSEAAAMAWIVAFVVLLVPRVRATPAVAAQTN